MNKYKNWYNSIIKNAQNRQIDGYVEKHHIIPQSLGGSNETINLVKLTAREHFICHWLLVKFQTGKNKSKMIYALNGMKRNGDCTQRYETKITSRVYENLKKQFSIVHSATMTGRTANNKGRLMSEEQKAKIRATKAANPFKPSKEWIEHQSEMKRGTKRSAETRLKMSLSAKGKLKGPMSAEGKRIRSEAAKGKLKSPEQIKKRLSTIAAQRAAGTHYSQTKIQCPYCPVKASKGKFNQFHGLKCKHAPV